MSLETEVYIEGMKVDSKGFFLPVFFECIGIYKVFKFNMPVLLYRNYFL